VCDVLARVENAAQKAGPAPQQGSHECVLLRPHNPEVLAMIKSFSSAAAKHTLTALEIALC
jgi:hypothetical protein